MATAGENARKEGSAAPQKNKYKAVSMKGSFKISLQVVIDVIVLVLIFGFLLAFFALRNAA